MEDVIQIKLKISKTKPMYDEEGMRIDSKKLELMLFTKLKEIIKDYIDGGGAEIDFLNSEFGVEEADELSYYGDIEFEVVSM